MLPPIAPDAEDHAASDEKRRALGFLNEAFAESILAGLDADCFAQAALFTALQEFVETYGEEAVAQFAGRLPDRIRRGEFSVRRAH